MRTLLNRKAMAVIASVYFFLTMVLHREVNEFFDVFLRWLDWPTFNRYALYSAFLFGTALVAWFIAAISKREERLFWISALIVWFGLAYAAHFFLLVSNIEFVHYPQYAILTLLIFWATRRETLSVLLAFLLGVVDEGFQYAVLYAGVNSPEIYLDYNDMILNLLGAILGMIIYLACFQPSTTLKSALTDSPL